MPFLRIEDLRIHFNTRHGTLRAVDGLSLHLEKGETLGIVGESGSGKSVTFYSILGLIPRPPGEIVGGKAIFDGVDLLSLRERALNTNRSKKISIIFQDPMTSLNPVCTTGSQVMEAIILHQKVSRQEARKRNKNRKQQEGSNNI